MVGLAVGVTRMVLEFAFSPPRCGVFDPAPPILRRVHYLHFAIILCAITVMVTVAISLLTPAPSKEQVPTLTELKPSGKISHIIIHYSIILPKTTLTTYNILHTYLAQKV